MSIEDIMILEKIYSLPFDFWDVLSEMSPYLLFGFFVAGILSVLISAETVQKNLGKRGLLSIVKAAIFGVPLPLCSCGVIPVTATLRMSGASKGATTAFLISTPQTGVDSIFVTYSLLGGVFAIFRPLMALVNGIIGGSLVELLDRNRIVDDKEKQDFLKSGNSFAETGGRIRRLFEYGFVTLPSSIGKELIIGLVIAAAITAMIPDDFFADMLGNDFLAMLVMMAVGIPIYVCSTASVPIAAAFMMKGISPGAALVFLMVGPATNAAAISIVWKIMGKRTTVIYLATIAGTAILSGILLNFIYTAGDMPMHHHGHTMIPEIIQTLSAITLLAVLGYALFKPQKQIENFISKTESMEKFEMPVSGMTCPHCQMSVKGALGKVEGVDFVEVDLKKGIAHISGENVAVNSLKSVVSSIGYTPGDVKIFGNK